MTMVCVSGRRLRGGVGPLGNPNARHSTGTWIESEPVGPIRSPVGNRRGTGGDAPRSGGTSWR